MESDAKKAAKLLIECEHKNKERACEEMDKIVRKYHGNAEFEELFEKEARKRGYGYGGGLVGADWSPPSQEDYAAQSTLVQDLIGTDNVFWTESGSKYHLYDDCQYLKRDRTTEIIYGGTVADVYANNSKIKPEMSSLCSACEGKAKKAKGIQR